MTSSITGGCKFFEKNFALFRDGATATASSNESAIKFALALNPYVEWESIGSNDLTTETVVVTFPEAKSINRIFLKDFNFKTFNIKYFNGSTFVDFANVSSINSEAKIAASETSYNLDTCYYEFDEISTTQVQIEVSSSQIADAQKFLGLFVATKELGTLQGFPRIKPTTDRNEIASRMLSEKVLVNKSYMTKNIQISFKTHSIQNDLDVIENIFNREEAFFVWPCGGRQGTSFFKVEQNSWRLTDLIFMQTTGNLKDEYEKGVYTLGFNKTLRLVEHI